MSDFNIASYPAAESCRLVDFEKAEIHPGTLPGTWFLAVSGIKPCLNMRVELVPRFFVRCPEYWGIEVMGCLPDGICLPAVEPYKVTTQLAGVTGSKGIEVIGANKYEKVKVSGGCEHLAAQTSN